MLTAASVITAPEQKQPKRIGRKPWSTHGPGRPAIKRSTDTCRGMGEAGHQGIKSQRLDFICFIYLFSFYFLLNLFIYLFFILIEVSPLSSSPIPSLPQPSPPPGGKVFKDRALFTVPAVFNSERPTCLCLCFPAVGFKGVHYHPHITQAGFMSQVPKYWS